MDRPAVSKPRSAFRRMTLAEFSDVQLFGATLYDLAAHFGAREGRLDCTTESGNRIICEDTSNAAAMKRTRVFLAGRNNAIHLGRLTGISRLDIACLNASTVTLGQTEIVRGATIMAAHQSRISIGAGCMISRDIVIYGSGAHGLFNSADGERRGSADIAIGDRVWIGQGARVLAGADVGAGSVIGSYSVLAGRVPNNCAAAGNPCRVTTRNIFWTAETVAGNYFLHLEKSGRPVPDFARMTEPD